MSSRSQASTSARDGSKIKSQDAAPRLSASLLLLNDKYEVLMIQRTTDSRTFAGMHAFPGGNYDAKQDGTTKDLRMTAIRETFEETGILLASSTSPRHAPPTPSQLSLARQAIHSRTDPTTFPGFLSANNLSVQASTPRLIPFSQWVTPASAKARFWTWFYVAFLDEMDGVLAADDVRVTSVETAKLNAESTSMKQGDVLERSARDLIPTHDNHIEIQKAYFQPPREIIQAFDRGEISLMPPQFYLLTMLANILERAPSTGGSEVRELMNRGPGAYVREVVGRGFGERVFNPRFGGKIVGNDGVERSILMYEGDAEYERSLGSVQYGGVVDEEKEGMGIGRRARHRSLLTFVEGRPRTIQIARNIDVLGLGDSSGARGSPAKL